MNAEEQPTVIVVYDVILISTRVQLYSSILYSSSTLLCSRRRKGTRPILMAANGHLIVTEKTLLGNATVCIPHSYHTTRPLLSSLTVVATE